MKEEWVKRDGEGEDDRRMRTRGMITAVWGQKDEYRWLERRERQGTKGWEGMKDKYERTGKTGEWLHEVWLLITEVCRRKDEYRWLGWNINMTGRGKTGEWQHEVWLLITEVCGRKDEYRWQERRERQGTKEREQKVEDETLMHTDGSWRARNRWTST